MTTIVLFLLGLGCLIAGAEALVRGASRLAAALGISPLVIGLTVVAFGTSSPELAVAIKSAFAGRPGIAVGNVVGSNIFNVLFVLGLSALLVPMMASRQLLRLDVPLMIGLSVLTLVLSLDGNFSRLNGVGMVLVLIVYLWFLIRLSRKEKAEVNEEYARQFGASKHPNRRWFVNIIMVVAGLALLVVGSRWLVNSAVVIATYFGISEVVIGLTVVAAGTSLPEVVTSIMAAVRGERDIAVGNIIGSNIFNILCVLGITSIVAPSGIEVSPAVVRFDMPVMIAVALACLPIFFTGCVISRAEGALLLGYYVAYTLYLVLAASDHDALPEFSAVMLLFVIPLTFIMMTTIALQELRRRKGCAAATAK